MLNGNIGVIKSMIAGKKRFATFVLSSLTPVYDRFDGSIEHGARLCHDARHVVGGRHYRVRGLSVVVA